MQQPLLSIITINYNNAKGLEQTLASVDVQTSKDFEHIIVDGASTDGSVEIIKKHDDGRVRRIWVSEKDSGIYNAMNKGIRMAHGRYLQFLNSGDFLVDSFVVDKMLKALVADNFPPILYGNLINITKKGRYVRNRNAAGNYVSAWTMYHGALTHASAYIEQTLFEKFGLYDENLRIVSDWKWYFEVMYNGGIQPVYADLDVVFFNLSGISETNHELNASERRKVIEELLPPMVLADYDSKKSDLFDMAIINRHPVAKKLQGLLIRFLRFQEKIKQRKASMVLAKEISKGKTNV